MNYFPQHRTASSRRRIWLAGMASWYAAWLLLFSSQTVPAQSAAPEYQVKAAFLYNFAKFVEWPESNFANPDAPLVIGVFGNNPFHGDLRRVVEGKSINGHRVVVQEVSAVTNLKTCDIVFIAASEQADTAQIAAALADAKVLTVTENMKHFGSSGLVINFVTEDDRIRFQINHAAATRAGLVISSKLLSLARPPEP